MPADPGRIAHRAGERDVELTARRNDAPPTAPVGLHAVMSIGGDLSLTLYGTHPDVFDNLTHLSGDLLVQGWTGAAGNLDIGGSQLLPAMTAVDGNLTLQGLYTTTNMFNQLESVGGDLRVERARFYASPSFQSRSRAPHREQRAAEPARR